VPDFAVRFFLWLLTHSIFRIRIVGQENVPFRGPALLVSNHMSHVDGFLIGACIQRFVRFMVWKPFYEMKALNWFMRMTNAIPVGTGNRRDVVESIRAARRELEAGSGEILRSPGCPLLRDQCAGPDKDHRRAAWLAST